MSLTDAGSRDSGGTSDVGDDNGTSQFVDAGESDDGGCQYQLEILDTPEDSIATGISPDGTIITVGLASLDGFQGALWTDAGLERTSGYRLQEITGISANYIVGTVSNSPFINPPEAYRQRRGQPLELLGDAGSWGHGINDEGTAVGQLANGPGMQWLPDGGRIRSASNSVILRAISSDGIAVGENFPMQSALMIKNSGEETTLPSPAAVSEALAVSRQFAVGYAFVPTKPVLWRLPSLEFAELETGSLSYGQADCVSEQGFIGGTLASSNPQDIYDSFAAVWHQQTLLWIAPRTTTTRIMNMVGVSLSGSEFAAQCLQTDSRRACKIRLHCQPPH